MIKKIKGIYLKWRFNRAVKKFEKISIDLLKNGNVRELKVCAENFRRLGEQLQLPSAITLAESIERHAESIVLARVFK